MKAIKIISGLGLVMMLGIITYGFVAGDFASDGISLINNPWGLVSMVDLYTGFILFSCWIIFRERSILRAFIWVFLMMALGFFTGSLYTLYAAYVSKGDWAKFWMGDRMKMKVEK